VLIANVATATRNTVVVEATLIRTTGVDISSVLPVLNVVLKDDREPTVPNVADTVFMPATSPEIVVVAAATNSADPDTSQSPGVKLTLVMFTAVPLVRDVPDAVFVSSSPTLPALALFAAVVPTMPAVCDGVIDPVKVHPASAQ
jgi:hypothetical protein